MGGFGCGRAAGGEQVDGRQQGIAFDGTVQQEGLAGLAVAGGEGIECAYTRAERRRVELVIRPLISRPAGLICLSIQYVCGVVSAIDWLLCLAHSRT